MGNLDHLIRGIDAEVALARERIAKIQQEAEQAYQGKKKRRARFLEVLLSLAFLKAN